jgi:hypothetical protein
MSLTAPTSDLSVRKSVGADVVALAPILREDDLKEIADMSGRDPLQCLAEAYVESEKCYTVTYKGEVAAMMGVVRSPHTADPALGVVWLLGSDKVALFGFSFTRWARAWLLELIDGFDVVGNLVSEDNVMHVRFLKRIGARIVKAHQDCGPGKVCALEFVFTRESLQENP